jgi:imidazolonepropionase
MQRNYLIRGARQLVTLHGPSGPRRGDALRTLGVIEDGSVLVVDGLIASVGPTRRIENLADARTAEEINATGRVVIPGFVDSHTRLISAPARLTQFRSVIARPGSAAISGLVQYMRNTPAGTLEFQARRYMDAVIRHGTTTFEVKCGCGLNASGEMKILRTVAALADGCLRVVPSFLSAWTDGSEHPDPSTYIRWASAELIPRLRERRIVRFAAVDCNRDGIGVDDSRLWLEAAARAGLPVKVLADQSERTGGAQLAVEARATSAEGLNSIENRDVEALSRSSTMATLLPGIVQQGHQDRFPPARALVDGGAAVAIASGFDPCCGSTFNMQAVLSLACTEMQMTAEEAISAATINGAHAAGEASRCGSLEFGKDADLLLLDVSDYREIPLYFGCAMVAVAMRKGRILYRAGAPDCSGA